MKQFLLLTAALLLGCIAFAQKVKTISVPLLSNPNIVVNGNEDADANQLYKGQMVHFAFAVLNPSQSSAIKAGTCSLQIELGDKLQVTQNALAKTALSNYFNWSIVTDANGKLTLNGKLMADLPADFTGNAFLELRCAEIGTSSIRAQWLDANKVKQGSLSTLDFTVKKISVKANMH